MILRRVYSLLLVAKLTIILIKIKKTYIQKTIAKRILRLMKLTLMNGQIATSFNAGDKLPVTSNYLWLITSGVVKVQASFDNGNIITLGFWGEEDVIGKPLTNSDYQILKCVNETKAISLPRCQWQNVSENLFLHIQQKQQLIFITQHISIIDRVWLILVWLAKKFGREVSLGRLIDFAITSQELADILGIRTVSVANILNQLEQQKLILCLRNKGIILRQLSNLSTIKQNQNLVSTN